MKAHIGVDADSGLVHTVAGTGANMSDLNMAGALLHARERDAFADAGHQGVHSRDEAKGPTWHVAMRRGLRKKLNPLLERDHLREQIEQLKASVRAKVEHPFRVIKRQFGFVEVRYRGLEKNVELGGPDRLAPVRLSRRLLQTTSHHLAVELEVAPLIARHLVASSCR